MNGNGDTEICAKLAEHSNRSFKINTPNSDQQYESELQLPRADADEC